MSSIDRPAHTLRREKTLAMPRHVIFFDTETWQRETITGDVEHSLRLGWACYYSPKGNKRTEKVEWFSFTSIAEFWSWLFDHIPNKNKLWVIAHQLSFDFTIMQGFQALQDADYKLRFFHNAGVTTIISVRKPGKSIMFVDSLNWFAESLATIGERIGFPKGKVDFKTVDDSELSIYCHRDVEILLEMFKAFVRFLHTNRISRLCYTLGSTAFAAYLFGAYDHTIYIHNNAQAIDLERESYRGGRTECFFIGELPDALYHVVDVNSLYPYVMREHSYPVRYQKIVHKVDPQELVDNLRTRAAIARVTLNCTEPVFAVRRDRLIFPTGRFTVTLCTPELQYALDRNWIESIDTCVYYEQQPIFAKYVDKFYALRNKFRADDDKLYEQFIKLLLNSLYGKFGQKADVWEKVGTDPDTPAHEELCYDHETGRRYKIRYLLGTIYESQKQTESYNSFPAIASHVTAYARMYLWDIMRQAGPQHYFYCDTDSLLLDPVGFARLADMIDPTTLGLLKLEYSTNSVTIYGAKDYVFGDHVRLKGIRSKAKRLGETLYEQEQWPTLRGMLSRNQADKYVVKTITKRLTRLYLKGVVQTSGHVLPFVLDGPA